MPVLPNTKMSKNFPKLCISFPISYFCILVKISTKSEQKYQLQMHKNVHKNVNKNMFSFIHMFYVIFQEFYGGQLKQQICYSFTLLISYMAFNPFKIAVQFF